MKYYNAFLQNLVLRRWTVLFMLAGILFLFRSLMTILLLTFIFTYLIYRLVLLLHRKSHLPIKLTSILTYSLIVFYSLFSSNKLCTHHHQTIRPISQFRC